MMKKKRAWMSFFLCFSKQQTSLSQEIEKQRSWKRVNRKLGIWGCDLQMQVYHSHHMTWISALTHFCFWLHSRGGPHIHWRAAAAGHDGALRTSLPCSPPWISMDFNARKVKRITFWIILWGRNVPCGTGVHWGETMIDTGRAQALCPEYTRWDNKSSVVLQNRV